MPPAIAQIFTSDSVTPYFILGSIFTILKNRKSVLSLSSFEAAVLIIPIVLICLHYAISDLIVPNSAHDLPRFVGYLICITVLLVCSFAISQQISNVSQKYYERVLNQVVIVFMVSLGLAFVEVNIFNGTTDRPVGFFHEPSHFALTFAPFYLWWMLSAEPLWRWLMNSILFIYGIFYGSLIIILLPMLYFSMRPILLLLVTFVCIVVLALTNSEYFMNRLNLFGEPTYENLYFLQSYDEMFRTLDITNLFGLGFGQFGVLEPSSTLAQKVFEITGDYVVRYEGANEFIKVTSELGLFGIAFSVVWMFVILRAYFNIRKLIKYRLVISQSVLFANCVIFTSVLLLLVRGGGYFSFSIMMLVASITYLHETKSVSAS